MGRCRVGKCCEDLEYLLEMVGAVWVDRVEEVRWRLVGVDGEFDTDR